MASRGYKSISGCSDSIGGDGVGLTFAPNYRGKRIFDVVVAAFGLALLAPIMIITSIAIKLSSPGPIFSRETLFGYGNRALQVYKFRSRRACSDGNKPHSCATWVGRVLRQTGIDELPQLFNVLRGDMSVVGPRPCGKQDSFEYRSHYLLPLMRSVKPGMISSTRFSGTDDDFRTTKQRVDDDFRYAATWSPLLDIKILLMALFVERSSADRQLTNNNNA